VSNRPKLPNLTDQSRSEFETFKGLARHPLLAGELIEDLEIGFNVDGSLDRLNVTTARLSHGLGQKPRGYLLVKANRGNWSVSEKTAKRDYSDVYMTSSWEFVEKIAVTVDTTTVAFGNLDGNLDHEYRLEGHWKSSSGSQDELHLHYNGDTSNHFCVYTTATVSAISSTSDTDDIVLARDSGANVDRHYVRATMTAELSPDEHRYVHGSAVIRKNGTSGEGHTVYGVFNDSASKVSSLTVVSASSGIAAESWFALYRRPRTAKVSIWVF
jgi:hypothetical protein